MISSPVKLFEALTSVHHPKVLCLGKNYMDHVVEMGGQNFPKDPLVFQKPYACVLSGQTINLPRNHDNEIHHELELGFMIGKVAKDVDSKDWKDYVGGYFLALDLTDRVMQAKFKKDSWPWDLSKGQDNFLCVSPMIEQSAVKDPHNLGIRLRINEKIVQHGKTHLMYYKIPTIIAYLSSLLTLNPGDLILTGTPSGVGPIKAGDKLFGDAYELDSENKTIISFEFNVAKEKKQEIEKIVRRANMYKFKIKKNLSILQIF